MKDESSTTSSFILQISSFGLLIALFFSCRIPLLLLRASFFDELFTRWISGKSFAGILAALRHDSGPPLYYDVVHLLGDPSVTATRVLSLAFAVIAIVLVLRMIPLAAILLAVFPPAVLFAVDARAYAMCALFVGVAVLAIDRDRPVLAAIALVAAAYSHYYGVLLFPILLIHAVFVASGASPAGPPAARRRFFNESPPCRRRSSRRAAGATYLAAFVLAIVLYIPGFWLALHQPSEARAWMTASWPDALFVRPPILLAIAGVVTFVFSVRVNRYLLMVLVPLVLAVVLRVYVPMRFEAVMAAPLALWVAESLRRNRFRLALATALIAVGAIWSALGILDHAGRPPDPYRQAAVWVAANIPAGQTVVASGYCYLEALMNGHERVVAFPPEQADHPGWRALPRSGTPASPGVFFWIGERGAPELALFTGQRHTISPLFINDRAMVARVR
jgi:hypothetical protein